MVFIKVRVYTAVCNRKSLLLWWWFGLFVPSLKHLHLVPQHLHLEHHFSDERCNYVVRFYVYIPALVNGVTLGPL